MTFRVDARGSSEQLLAQLLQPIAVDTFLTDFWQKLPLHVERRSPGYFASLFSLSAFDELLNNAYSFNAHAADLKVSRNGSLLPPSDYSREIRTGQMESRFIVDVDKVYALYRAGATIILNQVDQLWVPLSKFYRRLEQVFGVFVAINAYLTPPNSKGGAVHHDTHDVFAAQIHGSKRWRLFPSKVAHATPETPSVHSDFTGLGPAAELELAEGDLLYIPRGVPHDAKASKDHSLHLTIGIHPYTWGEALHDLVTDLVKSDVEFRKPVLGRMIETQIDPPVLEACFRKIVERLSRTDFTGHIARKIDQNKNDARSYLCGQLELLVNNHAVTLETVLALRNTVSYRLTRAGDSIMLSFHDKQVALPSFVEPQLTYLLSRDSFRACELPKGLDDAGKLVLVKRLVEEGFLELPRDRPNLR